MYLTVESARHSLRHVFNAIVYLVKTGCQWRMLPQDFPKWQLVYFYFNQWKRNGTLEQMQLNLVEKIRGKAGRKLEPTVGIIDA